MLLIGCGSTLKNKQYFEHKRIYSRSIEDVDTEGTLLTCHWPKDEGKVMLTPEDKQLLTKDSFRTFSNCDSLALNNLEIVDMEGDVFSTMHDLEYLYISNNKIVIRPDVFHGLKLVSLYLTNMSIVSLSDRIFAGLDNLWDLSLANNPLNEISDQTFYGLTNVGLVNLANSNVVVKPGFFKHLSGLLHLDISGTPFKFTEGMWNEISLESLKLGNVNIANLRSELWDGLESSLEVLDLDANYFETIMAQPFQNLTKLQRLLLNNCSMTSYDLTASTWTGIGASLKFLFLGHNYFPTLLAHSFQGLVRLEILEIANCGIEHIEAEALEGLVALDTLHLQGNPLLIMDEAMFGLTSKSPYFYIYFANQCENMSCFPDLCWINDKFKTSIYSSCETSCGNYNVTVKRYLENECE